MCVRVCVCARARVHVCVCLGDKSMFSAFIRRTAIIKMIVILFLDKEEEEEGEKKDSFYNEPVSETLTIPELGSVRRLIVINTSKYLQTSSG